MFVSGSPKIIQLDNKMSFDALKQTIGNMISLSNGALIKSTYLRCNALFNKRRREVTTMVASIQVYSKPIKDTQRKASTHTVLEFDRHETWFLIKGDVTVANSKNCTCIVLMLLLLVMSPTYTEDCLENCATKRIGHHVTSQCSAPTQTRKNSKGHLVSSRIHTEMNIREPGQPKRCFMCRIPDHSKKTCPHRVGSSDQR
ncbi:hypothetical protein HKD37_18G051357 [Glycine soja]